MGDKNQWNYYVLQNFYIIARDGGNGNANPNAQKCKLLFAFCVIMHTRVKLKEDSHKDYPSLFGAPTRVSEAKTVDKRFCKRCRPKNEPRQGECIETQPCDIRRRPENPGPLHIAKQYSCGSVLANAQIKRQLLRVRSTLW